MHRLLERAVTVAIAAAAALLLFWDLGSPYLWQDEAATAILGERLFEHGKPLAYDGKNLVSMDSFADEDLATIDQRTADPESAIRYLVKRGDFREDLAWTGQPWGQFVAAGASLSLFGHHTVAARLPFSIAAFLTVLVLYRFAHRMFGSQWMAAITAGLLLGNVYWVLHARQARYYSLSGLFLLLTVIAFLHWLRRGRYGAALFVGTAWVWFQIDFGTFWPVIGTLAACALFFRLRFSAPIQPDRGDESVSSGSVVGKGQELGRILVPFGALLASVAPWIWYYQLLGRLKQPASTLDARLLGNLFHLNQFLIPLVLYLVGAVALWRWKWRRNRTGDSRQQKGAVEVHAETAAPPVMTDDKSMRMLGVRRGESTPVPGTSETRAIIGICVAILPAVYFWVSLVAPWHFYRYFVAVTPLAALLTAWIAFVLGRGIAGRLARPAEPSHITVGAITLGIAMLTVITPILSNMTAALLAPISHLPRGTLLRAELSLFGDELFGERPDPNRIVVEYLREHANPEDEILATYEDLPLQFYLGNPIRGGVTGFRVEAPAPPRFLVVRQSVSFLHWPVFQREIARHRWVTAPIHAPDIPFGNNPDPEAQARWTHPDPPDLILAERADL